jgi:hypothetical protein
MWPGDAAAPAGACPEQQLLAARRDGGASPASPLPERVQGALMAMAQRFAASAG